jgi:hypothetical protein
MIINIENFLEDASAKKIYQQLSAPEFPWSYYDHVIFNNIFARSCLINPESFAEELPCFRHTFYSTTPSSNKFQDWRPNLKSPHYNVILPLVVAIEKYFGPKKTFFESVHGNLMLQNPLYVKTALAHFDRVYNRSDHLQYDTYTGLYYLNTCDAETVLYNEHYDVDNHFAQAMTEYQRIKPEFNKLVLWDSRRFHSSPACGDTSRFLINLNLRVAK